MANTYALPLNGPVRHGHGHARSQHRVAPQERFPSQHMSIDSSPTRKEISATNPHKHSHSHSYPDRAHAPSETNDHRFNSNVDYSAAKAGANGHTNGQAKGMEYYANQDSVVVRPRGYSYGLPKVDRDTNHSKSQPTSAKVSARSVQWGLLGHSSLSAS